jgi:hypothetical protein
VLEVSRGKADHRFRCHLDDAERDRIWTAKKAALTGAAGSAA